MKQNAEQSLGTAARILAGEVLKMVKRELKGAEGKEPDPKLLKDVGAAVKEAVSVVTALGKAQDTDTEGIRIVFDMGEDFTQ